MPKAKKTKKGRRKRRATKSDAEGSRLSLKQESFVLALLGAAQGNAAEAARMAGYRSKTPQGFARIGEENRRKPEIAKAIEEGMRELAARGMADAVEVQTFLTSVMRGTECRRTIVTMAGVARDPETGEVLTDPPEARDRVKAAAELVKVLGLAAPKKVDLNHAGAASVSFVFEDNGRGPA